MTKQERINNWNENFKKWNAFNDDLETFLVMGNTFSIKDELKKKGAKFSPELGWHFDHEEPGYTLEKVTYSEVGQITQDGKLILDYDKASELTKKLQEKYIEPTNSDWVGEINEKRSFIVELVDIRSFQGTFGYTDILTFKDEEENTIVWFTGHGKGLEVGNHYYLKGTIKAHRVFREDKQTVVNRCTIEKLED